MRDLIKENLGKFPLQETIAHYRGSIKSISFSEDDIENILDLQYGKAKTYCALTLLYPGLNYNFKYHQDHIHSQSFFNGKRLRKLGLTEDQVDNYLNSYNSLPNLQLLQATQNVEKKDKPFKEWLAQAYPSQTNRESFLLQHHINTGESLALKDYINFVTTRRKVLKSQLMNLLQVSSSHINDEAEQLIPIETREIPVGATTGLY